MCKSETVPKRWRQLFVRLCVGSKIETSDEVEDIETSNLDDNTCCHKALTRWKDMTSKPTVWNLVDALRSTKCTVVAGLSNALFSTINHRQLNSSCLFC